MEKKLARKLSNFLRSHEDASTHRFHLKEYINKQQLFGFHQWVDGRACEGAFLFKGDADQTLWILLIDWRANGNFYVVMFPKCRSGPIAEIHRIDGESDYLNLQWRYLPRKRDKSNEERKLYFASAFFSLDVQISIPQDGSEVDDFIGELFSLAESRLKADRLDPDRPAPRCGFPEGKLKEKLHLSRERNRKLVKEAKALALTRHGRLKCACCGFDFLKEYGEIGRGYIEAHHTRPLSSLHVDGEETNIEDLALVCPNCHRMLHRRRPWLEMHELTKLKALKK